MKFSSIIAIILTLSVFCQNCFAGKLISVDISPEGKTYETALTFSKTKDGLVSVSDFNGKLIGKFSKQQISRILSERTYVQTATDTLLNFGFVEMAFGLYIEKKHISVLFGPDGRFRNLTPNAIKALLTGTVSVAVGFAVGTSLILEARNRCDLMKVLLSKDQEKIVAESKLIEVLYLLDKTQA